VVTYFHIKIVSSIFPNRRHLNFLLRHRGIAISSFAEYHTSGSKSTDNSNQPENLLLDSYLNVTICDFGWCAEDINAKRTSFCGIYEYMAPKIIFMAEYNYRVDTWAL
jgi:serine/threonine protein kinase